jgi:Flp pilus assembly protein TadG
VLSTQRSALSSLWFCKKDDSGQSMVESALSGALLFLFFFAVLDVGFLFYSKVTLQNAVRTAGRYAITGNCGTDGGPGSNCFVTSPQDRLNVILQTVTTYAFNLQPVTISVQCIQGACPGYAGQGANNAGGPGDVVQISATYTYHPIIMGQFFTGGAYTFTVSSTYKNEQFSPPAS